MRVGFANKEEDAASDVPQAQFDGLSFREDATEQVNNRNSFFRCLPGRLRSQSAIKLRDSERNRVGAEDLPVPSSTPLPVPFTPPLTFS